MGKALGTSNKYPPTPLDAQALRCACAKDLEGYPPVAKSAEAAEPGFRISTVTAHVFIHKQNPSLHAEVCYDTQAWFSA